MAGSGKSTAISFLQKNGFSVIYFGALTLNELKKRNLPVNEANEKLIRNQLRKEFGLGVYALLAIPKIHEVLKKTSKLALDGIYSWEEVKVLKKEFGNVFKLIAVLTSPETRYKRLTGRKIRSLSLDEAIKRDLDEIENLNKGGTIAMADCNIINENSLNLFEQKLSEGIQTWL